MSMKVLIADPDWRFSRKAAAYLESRAHLVVQQTHAERVIEAVEHWRPDLLIVSEELAGQGLLGELHGRPNRPAILLVGWMDRYDRVWRAWQQGGDELLMKPVFTSEELHAAIVAALENAATGVRIRPAALSA